MLLPEPREPEYHWIIVDDNGRDMGFPSYYIAEEAYEAAAEVEGAEVLRLQLATGYYW